MQKAQKYALWLTAPVAITLAIGLFNSYKELVDMSAIGLAVLFSFGIGSIGNLKSYQYTAWIIASIVCGLIYPQAFLAWGNIDLRNPWLILVVVQLVMFGMGTQMSYKDFSNIKYMGKGVLVGILCQFTIMPLIGYVLTLIFNFEPEIAAGVILMGSCSSGLASNVMVYIARANLTLSVSLTATATLLAPIMTPLLMKILAGEYIYIDFLDMFLQIVKIVIVPIGAAMLVEVFKYGSSTWIKRINILFILSILWLMMIAFSLWILPSGYFSEEFMMIAEAIGFFCEAIVVGKVFYHVTIWKPGIVNFIPKISMFGIVYFTLVTTAASSEKILTIGLIMLLTAILHNSLGYILGYWFSGVLGLDKNSCRTVALEVGLQNGGMASGLAGMMGKLGTVGLASAVFSPWMNISGSLLGNYWRIRRPKNEI